MAEPINLCNACGHDNLPDSQICGRCGAALLPSELEPAAVTGRPERAATAEELEYAGFWLRFLGLVTDGVILVVLLWVLGLLLGDYRSSGILLLVPPVYFWLFTGLRAQTPGKVAVRIYVVSGAGDAAGLGRAAFRELLGRQVLYLFLISPLLAPVLRFNLAVSGHDNPGPFLMLVSVVAVVLVPLGLLGFVWIIWDPRKQGWHDKFARTYVVKLPRGSRQLRR